MLILKAIALWDSLIVTHFPRVLSELEAQAGDDSAVILSQVAVAPNTSPSVSHVVGLRSLIFDSIGSFGTQAFNLLKVGHSCLLSQMTLPEIDANTLFDDVTWRSREPQCL